MSILIVDDQPFNTRLLQTMLQRAGYPDTLIAGSGEEALRVLSDGSSRVELVLMDIMMPGMNGIDVVKVIRRQPLYSRLPVIMATALDEEASLDAAFAAGATDYLTKPFRPIELRARVTSALAIAREIRDRELREKQLNEMTLRLEEANRQLHAQSLLDGLTGIANRRAFNDALDTEVRRARRAVHTGERAEDMAVIMLDIDFFKQFNDTYGHVVGDEAIKAVAAALKRCMKRPGDMVARIGGEEFACILPGTSLEGARLVAESMRRRVEWLDIQHEGSQIEKFLTISLGVASGSVASEGEFMRLADEALYESKKTGRNRVSVREVPAPANQLEAAI